MSISVTSVWRLDRRKFLASAMLSLPTLRITSSGRAAEVAFTVTEFRHKNDAVSGAFAMGINRKATAVGIATTQGTPSAVRSGGSALQQLPDNDRPGIANAVNDDGTIVGSVDALASRWTDDELTMLAPYESKRTTAYAISSAGQIVGSADGGANSAIALAWNGDEVRALPSLGGPSSRATGINRDGIVVGYSTLDEEGAIVRAVQWIDDEVHELGTLGGERSEARAINKHGVVVGSSTEEAGFSAVDHAFVYQDGTMTALARPGAIKIHGRTKRIRLDRSVARAVADSGEICGVFMSVSENAPVSIAALWLDDEAFSLNTLIGDAADEITLTSADGINADRELVCSGYVHGDESTSRIFRLHPR